MNNSSIFRKREKPEVPEVEVQGKEIVIDEKDGSQKRVNLPKTTWK